MTRVVKIGGAALGDAAWLRELTLAVARAPAGVVVVHGGGPDISTLSERLGIAVTWNGGRRVTPPEALDVASMVLTGRLNKRIVSALLDAGADALGLSGEDGGLVVGGLAECGALGRVGVVERVRADLLELFVARGIVPVISPISRGSDGAPLNINADEVATAVARALGATELLFVTDVAGVTDASGVRRELSAAQACDLVATGVATAGMALKVTTAIGALEAGVACVRIGRAEIVMDPTAGTRIRQEAEALSWR